MFSSFHFFLPLVLPLLLQDAPFFFASPTHSSSPLFLLPPLYSSSNLPFSFVAENTKEQKAQLKKEEITEKETEERTGEKKEVAVGGWMVDGVKLSRTA